MNAPAALVLLFDIAAEIATGHDDWHTHEHMPERLGIPGFQRGTRWTAHGTAGAADAAVRYCVVYEVDSIAVLDSAAYRARLDHPTSWTSAMMRHYQGMRRALCTLEAGVGCGLGTTLLVITFAPAPEAQREVDRWLTEDILPGFKQRPGFAEARLYRNALAAAMTTEQAIRGRDATLHTALLVTGYDEAAVTALAAGELAPERFAAHGGIQAEITAQAYRQAYALAAGEIGTTLTAPSPRDGDADVDASTRRDPPGPSRRRSTRDAGMA